MTTADLDNTGILLAVRDLRVELPAPIGEETFTVVDGISFNVHRGETVALVGESGAGKSMTAAAVMHLLPDDAIVAGSIELDGRELTRLSERELVRVRGREIGLVFQDPSTALNPMYTAGWHVTEAVTLTRGLRRKAAVDAAREALVHVGFPAERFDAYPHELSGGMRQRAMLAIALAGEPKLLIADEPTTALDVVAGARIRAVLAELRRERDLALLVISHDLPMVAELASRVVVMYAGEVVEHGPTSAVFGAPAHPYTRDLLECLPPLGGHGTRDQKHRLAVIPMPDGPPGEGCRYAPRCRDVIQACRDEHPSMRPTHGGEARCILVPEAEAAR